MLTTLTQSGELRICSLKVWGPSIFSPAALEKGSDKKFDVPTCELGDL